MDDVHILEGYGPLDVFLAKQRYRIARRLIKTARRKQRILDIGCGCQPLFLRGVDFAERYGLDKNITAEAIRQAKNEGIELTSFELEREQRLPFDEDFFDVVTMLAVFEHIEPALLVPIHKQIRRILRPGGLYVMTTPAFWTDGLLRFLAKVGLISDVSIREHKGSYRIRDIRSVLAEAGFCVERLRYGYFELFMNCWVTVAK